MASSRRKGTNENISTYGNATRNYTSLATWEADTDNDLVTLTKSEVLECYDDATSFNDYVNMAGATTNSSYFRIIRPASGHGHDGTPNNGVTFISTTTATVFSTNEANSQIQDIIAKLTVNNASYYTTIETFGISSMLIGCIVFESLNSGTGQCNGITVWGNGSKAINCLAHSTEGKGFRLIPSANNSTITAYNCTSTNNGIGGFRFEGNTKTGTTFNLTNCLSASNTGSEFATVTLTGDEVINVTYCASDDATADDWLGTGNRINQTFSFVNSAGDDFHLVSTDAGARNWGTDLSADPTFPFDDDIDRGKRPRQKVWDIGFDEFYQEVIMGGGLGDDDIIMSPPPMW